MRASFVALYILLCTVLCALPRAASADVGEGTNGLPSMGRVAAPEVRTPRATVAGSVGYGYTEAQPLETGAHHRLTGVVAGAVQPLRFLSGALVLSGRRDAHPDDRVGSSSTTVGEPRLFLRAAELLGKGFTAGGQLVVMVPGGEAPSLKFDATTVDASLLGAYALGSLTIAANLGYRIDNSAKVIGDLTDRRRLRAGDRLTLATSDYDAFLVGIGASKRSGKLEMFGDVSWDVMLGRPSALESPLRLGLGARFQILETLAAELRPEVVLSERTTLLVPIEPRVSVMAGLRWSLPFSAEPAKKKTEPTEIKAPVHVAQGTVRGKVASDKGAAIAGAHVTIADATVEAGPDGSFTVDDVAAGHARVVATADGYEEAASEVTVADRGTANVTFALKRLIKPGQLRGLVRSFNGRPLAASIRVEPLGIETKTDSDGTFQIDVPPGRYELVVGAPGHAGQRRPVQVEENGVTVLNADLRLGP